MIRFEEKEHSCRAYIDGELTIYTATELKDDFTRLIADQREMELSLANVSEIDSSGIQWLMLAKRERSRKKLSFRLIDHSSEVLQIFEHLALAPYFDDEFNADKR